MIICVICVLLRAILSCLREITAFQKNLTNVSIIQNKNCIFAKIIKLNIAK